MDNNDRRTLEVERSTSTAHRLSEYDGVCGNIHGHNMHWDVTVTITMSETGSDNMPVDLKDVSSLIDAVDHATVLSKDDSLLQFVLRHNSERGKDEFEYTRPDANGLIAHEDIEPIGEVFVFDSDPTCEMLSEWMAEEILSLPPVSFVNLTVNETDKYGISVQRRE